MTQSPSPRALSGRRLRLVPLGPEHLDAVRRWRSDPEVTRYWITQEMPSEAAIRAWYERNQAEGALVWAVLHRDQAVGYVTLFDIDRVNRKAELALMIGERAAWGQGFASETLRIVLRHALSPHDGGGLGLNKIYLSVFAENVAARRAYQRCGFREDGILREDMIRDGAWHDQILMSVLAREIDDVEENPERSGPMILAFVTFRYGAGFDPEQFSQTSRARRDFYVGLEGLRQKLYWVDRERREAGGAYVWESREAAEGV